MARAETESAERARVRALLEAVPQPLWTYHAETGRLVWCNAAYGAAVDMSPADVVSQGRHLAPPPLQGAQEAKAPSRVTIVSGGQRRVMAVVRTPLPGTADVLGMALDISREEELERTTHRERAVYHDLLENLRSAIAIYDASQRLDFYNAAFAQLWGLPEQWLDTHPRLSDIMDRLRETRRLPEQADFPRFRASWVAMFTDLIEPLDDMLHLPDGTSLRLLVIAHPVGGLIMIFEDVTSRLALESSYNTLVAVQRETLDALVEGVAVFGGDGRLKLWNPAFAGLWDLPPEVLDPCPHIGELAEKMLRRLPFGAREAGRETLRALALTREEAAGQFLCAAGAKRGPVYLDYTSVPLPDGGVMVTFRDVTDAVRAERALEDKARALETAEALKADFLANVSYQLRTPLSAMMGFTEILQEKYFGPLNQKQAEYVEGLSRAGAELLRLINDILDLATIEAGHMELHPTHKPVEPMLRGLLPMVHGWAHNKQAEVVLDCPSDTLEVWCDVQRIRQALLNLARNALAYTAPGGRVTLGARAGPGAWVHLFVADAGPGIAPEDRARIFRPFERAAQPRGGAGLGLTLVKSIVEMHGGRVDLETRPGRGTRVTIALPPGPKEAIDA